MYTLCYRVLTHTGQLIQSSGNLWAFYLSVSVSYIWLYIVTQSGRASLLNVSQCVSRKSRGNLSQHLVEPQSKQKPAHKVSVQSSQVVNNVRGREREAREVKDVAGLGGASWGDVARYSNRPQNVGHYSTLIAHLLTRNVCCASILRDSHRNTNNNNKSAGKKIM